MDLENPEVALGDRLPESLLSIEFALVIVRVLRVLSCSSCSSSFPVNP